MTQHDLDFSISDLSVIKTLDPQGTFCSYDPQKTNNPFTHFKTAGIYIFQLTDNRIFMTQLNF